jgi:hypothetical protein
LFGAPKRDPSNNREMSRALDLGGRIWIMISNNQPIVGGSGRGDVWVEARGWESVWGDTVPSFGVTIQTMKKIYMQYTVAFGWPPIDNGSHNNQPKIGVHNRGKYGGEVRQAGGMWEM